MLTAVTGTGASRDERPSRQFVSWADVERCERDDDLQREVAAAREQIVRVWRVDYRSHQRVPVSRTLRRPTSGCTACGRPFHGLTWLFISARPKAARRAGQPAGWLAVCRPCGRQAEFFAVASH